MATTTQTTVQEDEYVPELDYNKVLEDYNISKKPILDAIMSNYKKPEPQIDPEQEKKAKFGAALTDTFGSLAEMFAHGQGALVSKRDTPGATQTTNARLQALKDKYDKDMLQYGAVKSNAELQDLNMYLSARREADGAKRSYNLYLAKKAQEEADRKAKAEIDKRDFDYKVNKDKNDEKLQREKLALAWAEFNKKNEKDKTPKTVPDKFEGIVINANDADGKATIDATGKKVIAYKMTKPEIINLANAAKRDASFIKENPNVYIDTVDRLGKAVRGLTSDENLAQMYAQWQYDKQYKKPQVAPDTKQFMPWLPKVNEQPTTSPKQATQNTKQTTTTNDPFAKYGGRTIK